ncbi:MAG TPA: efflux RND transporter periplasmic adaptor subunit [Methylomirabilota bacterium]|nr:efflux RND transporter periplasmic adaptor subunit [Methylomirabilota bacterium]
MRSALWAIAMVWTLALQLWAADAPPANKLANAVILDEIGVKNLNIELVEAEERDFEETLFTLGRIGVRPGRSAVVSSRIPGRAVSVHGMPDHPVEQGEPLVVVESRQPGNPPPQVTLTAPMSGVISEMSVSLGEPVSPEKSLLTIIDLSSVYGIAAVPEHLASRIKPGLAARIRVPGWPDRHWEAKVEHIGVLADNKAGSIEAAFLIDNPGSLLKPGMRAEFSIVTKMRQGVMSVPRSALQGDAGNRFVFVADDTVPNAFLRAPVQTGAINAEYVEIVAGLFPGDKVVARGGYFLAFAGKGNVSLKEALDAAHGHEHNDDGSEITAQQSGSAAVQGHEHGLGSLTIFSLVGNAVLLALLIGSSMRKRVSEEK